MTRPHGKHRQHMYNNVWCLQEVGYKFFGADLHTANAVKSYNLPVLQRVSIGSKMCSKEQAAGLERWGVIRHSKVLSICIE